MAGYGAGLLGYGCGYELVLLGLLAMYGLLYCMFGDALCWFFV